MSPHIWNSKMLRCQWRYLAKSASVTRGADAVADDEECACLRLGAEGKRVQAKAGAQEGPET